MAATAAQTAITSATNPTALCGKAFGSLPAAGTRWDDLPEDWGCPDCAVREKPDFEILEATK
jgi:rubredoxin